MRKTLEIVGFGLLAVLIASGLTACSSSKAGIILNVSTTLDVDRPAITALRVTVNGVAKSYDVGAASTWSLGIETSPGDKHIAVQGMAVSTVTAAWEGTVQAVAGQVVYQNVELGVVDTTPLDGGSGGSPGADAAMDGPTGNGGAPGRDGAIASGTGAPYVQILSVRQTARQCGHISISEQFKAWANMSTPLTLGKMYEAMLLVEVRGGAGSIDFTMGNVTVQ